MSTIQREAKKGKIRDMICKMKVCFCHHSPDTTLQPPLTFYILCGIQKYFQHKGEKMSRITFKNREIYHVYHFNILDHSGLKLFNNQKNFA